MNRISNQPPPGFSYTEIQATLRKRWLPVMKARKNMNMNMSKEMINLLIGSSMTKKGIFIRSLLRTLIKKQGLLKIGVGNPIIMDKGNVAKHIKRLEQLETLSLISNERTNWKKLLLNMSNLKALTLDDTMKMSEKLQNLIFRDVPQLRSLEELTIRGSWKLLLMNMRWFRGLTSLKRLSLQILFDDSRSETDEKIWEEHFPKFWEKLFKNQSLRDLHLKNFVSPTKDLPALEAFLDSLNSSKLSSFSLEFNVKKENESIFVGEKILRLIQQSEMIDFQISNSFFNLNNRPERAFSKEIYFFIEKEALLDIGDLLSKCKALQNLSIGMETLSSPFPNSFGGTKDMKSLTIEFSYSGTPKFSTLAKDMTHTISNLYSLEHLSICNYKLDVTDKDQWLELFQILALKNIKKFELISPLFADENSFTHTFQNLFEVIYPLKKLESLVLKLGNIGDENSVLNLLSLFSELKCLDISFKTQKDGLDDSLIFKNLSQSLNLEKLSLHVHSREDFNQDSIYLSLLPFKNLKELKIKTFAGRKFFEKPLEIGLEDYKNWKEHSQDKTLEKKTASDVK